MSPLHNVLSTPLIWTTSNENTQRGKQPLCVSELFLGMGWGEGIPLSENCLLAAMKRKSILFLHIPKIPKVILGHYAHRKTDREMEMPLGFLRKDHTREKKKKIADANMATLATMHRIFLFMFRCLFHQGNSTDVSWSSSRTQEMKQFRQVIGQDRKKYCYHVNLSSCLFLIAFHASAVVGCF